MKPLALVAALVLALLGLPAAPSSAEDPAPLVTWPAVTSFNPDTTAYTITLADAGGAGTLYAEWRGVRQELPHEGDVTLSLPGDGEDRVTLWRCDGATTCSQVAASPWLQAYRHLTVWLRGFPSVVSSPSELPGVAGFWPAGAGDTVHVTWKVVPAADPSGEPLATGTLDVQPNGEGTVPLSATVPAGVPTGAYRLRFEVSADLADFGHLEGGPSGVAFEVDTQAPDVTFARSRPVIYPIKSDDYLDEQIFVAESDEEATYRIRIRNASGDLVRTLVDGARPATRHREWWSGKDDDGRMVPEGRYVATVEATDLAGNTTTVRAKPFDVVLKRIHQATWRHTFTAASTVVDRYVGSCSTLARPSSHGWGGSLGYYSATRCANPRQSVVSTLSGVYVPESFNGKYGSLQVSLNGGGARGTRHNYIVMGYLRARDDRFVRRYVMQNALGVHPGALVVRAAEMLRFDRHHRPFFYWQTGLTEGSRYDVKSFTVEIEYTALD